MLTILLGQMVTAQNPTRIVGATTSESERSQALNVRQEWGLSEEQWHEYERLMQGNRGTWSPGLDPITALGVSTDSPSERRRLAELYVRTEFERTQKELAFQIEVDQAWKRLYPTTPLLRAAGAPATSPGQVERYAIIVKPECIECDAFVSQQLDQMTRVALTGVDIHVLGTDGDDDQLRQWVDDQPAILEALKARRVTVNHATDAFNGLTSLPVVFRKNGDGQWSRER
ncbi:MAG: TIGR03759 family integrating conjugative element protein [Pseudomonadota bacterium]